MQPIKVLLKLKKATALEASRLRCSEAAEATGSGGQADCSGLLGPGGGGEVFWVWLISLSAMFSRRIGIVAVLEFHLLWLNNTPLYVYAIFH